MKLKQESCLHVVLSRTNYILKGADANPYKVTFLSHDPQQVQEKSKNMSVHEPNNKAIECYCSSINDEMIPAPTKTKTLLVECCSTRKMEQNLRQDREKAAK